MLLTLTPPSDYLVPSTLHTHSLSVPQLPPLKSLKVPPVYTKAKQRLNDASLALPNYLAIDRALWWHYVIERVEWNLDREEVIVSLTDGSEERWSLRGNKSNEILSDDDEDTEMAEEEKSRGRKDFVRRRRCSTSNLAGHPKLSLLDYVLSRSNFARLTKTSLLFLTSTLKLLTSFLTNTSEL